MKRRLPLSEIGASHEAPEWPVVGHVVIPDIEPVWNVFAVEQFGHAVVAAQTDVVIGCGENHKPVAVIVAVVPGAIVARDVIDGVVEVSEFIVVAVEEASIVKGSGE